MSEVIYEGDGLVVRKDANRFFVRYDVGTHQVIIREDEISPEDAGRIMKSPADATKVLFELQRRLTLAGVDPYTSNL